MGYDGLFLGRVDHQDKAQREQRRELELLWRTSGSLQSPGSDLFTGGTPPSPGRGTLPSMSSFQLSRPYVPILFLPSLYPHPSSPVATSPSQLSHAYVPVLSPLSLCLHPSSPVSISPS